ncbi:hypothetical protein [Mucilaginibacter lacusdianchii]|uniref:hypothetical protein n=1 Tax=Mucilaginibacter lacusdianchii TaxID=2684211 RepID=UPI00131CBFD5|nr:hypothetical protein [Mucilaginibacter sp. JXJ CY 39]
MKLSLAHNRHAIVAIPELPAEQQEPFKAWLTINGQTQPCVDEYDDGDCAYIGDYQRWYYYWQKQQRGSSPASDTSKDGF